MFSNFCGDAFGGGGCLLLVAGSKFLGHLGVLGFCCVFLSGFCCHHVVASIDCPRFYLTNTFLSSASSALHYQLKQKIQIQVCMVCWGVIASTRMRGVWELGEYQHPQERRHANSSQMWTLPCHMWHLERDHYQKLQIILL